MKITKEVRQHRIAWLKALRSRKYSQAREVLNDGEAFCCLGVACDISGLGEWDGALDYVIKTDSRFDEESSTDLSPTMQKWLGISGVAQTHAINLNDRTKFSFKQIADHFEKRWRM